MKIIMVFLLTIASYVTVSAQASQNAAPNGLSMFAALPILETYVPQTVVTSLENKYGNKLYDITMNVSSTNQTIYIIRVEDNGVYSTSVLNSNDIQGS